jgi:UDP-2,4-diacetamido-2,4,6-trideoxy-beta-L-altropyranose hydrolase
MTITKWCRILKMENTNTKGFQNSNILIQADAGPDIGVGHIMRMFALAQLISKMGFSIHFASKIKDKQIIELIKKEGFTFHNLENLSAQGSEKDQDNFVNLCAFLNPKSVIMDGGYVESKTEKILKVLDFKLIRIIDTPQQHLIADLVINPNLGAEKFQYSLEPYVKTAFGLEYVILRNEFLNPESSITTPKELSKRILVSLGGSKINTKRIYDDFKKFDTLKDSKLELEIIDGLKTFNLASKMANSDFAFISGGSTMWEALKMKLPFHVITLNDLQKSYLASIDEYKYWHGTTHYDAVDTASIEKVIINYFTHPEIEDKLRTKFANLRIGESVQELIYQFLINEKAFYV